MPSRNTEPEETIGKIVIADFRAAGIFKNAGIDCFNEGEKSVEQVCLERNTDPDWVKTQLLELKQTTGNPGSKYNDWNIGLLADYIVSTHHSFVKMRLPDLVFYMNKIESVDGVHHPELIEIAVLVENVNTEMLKHLQNEEQVLFPAIKEVLKTNLPETKAIILSEIGRMKEEKEYAGAMHKINLLTSNYRVPEDGSANYRIVLQLLSQFEDDLHIHVHLENNILYPKALLLCN